MIRLYGSNRGCVAAAHAAAALAVLLAAACQRAPSVPRPTESSEESSAPDTPSPETAAQGSRDATSDFAARMLSVESPGSKGALDAPPDAAGSPAAPHPPVPVPTSGSANETVAPPAVDGSAGRQVQKEYWDAFYFGPSKAGFSHTTWRESKEDGQSLLEIRAVSELSLERFGQSIRQNLEFFSVETPAGVVVRCGSRMVNQGGAGDPVEIATGARVTGDQLAMEISTLGRKETRTVAWNASYGGYFAVEQSLERQPMVPGEKRSLRALLPGLNQLGEVFLAASDYEDAETLDGVQRLLRIEAQLKISGTSLDQTLWTDRSGQTIKSHTPALNQLTYRTRRETAMQKESGQKKYDLGEQTVVKLVFPQPNPHRTSTATYRASVARGDILQAFAQGATQAVRRREDNAAEIRVRALTPQSELGGDFPPDAPPQAADLRPNSLIQSDDDQVVALARSIAADVSDPWDVAVALEQHIRRYVSTAKFAQAMASAADVVRTREGDCTEHAVLLAALCRARQIPARVAIGLVYSHSVGGFAYHMWTEVWIKDRWIPLDGTLGLGGIGAAHLKVSHSNLEGVDPLSQFLPVIQLLGNLRLEVVQAS